MKDSKEFVEWLFKKGYTFNNMQNGEIWFGNIFEFEEINSLYIRFNKSNEDSIVQSVIKQFKERSNIGINKYGVTLDRTDLTRLEWLNHAQQEAMDMILYLEKLKTYEK
jgi:hypothetical protein